MPRRGEEHNKIHNEMHHLFDREGSELDVSVNLRCHHERGPKASTMNNLPLVLLALRCSLNFFLGAEREPAR